MSTRVVVLNYVPRECEFGWADEVIHPLTTDAELSSIAARLAWTSPLKVSLPPGMMPEKWTQLRLLWEEEWLFEPKNYIVREDPRLKEGVC